MTGGTVLIDYDSGNLHSAHKAFEKMAAEVGGGPVRVTRHAEEIAQADRIVLPGDGAFPACMNALSAQDGVLAALREAVEMRATPFLGICVGMQLMATRGLEYVETPGLGWIAGDVVALDRPAGVKVPHMGWNDLCFGAPHPVFAGMRDGEHAYFVHSYHMQVAQAQDRLAWCDYAGPVTAAVGRDTMIGLQFHPEKSARAGLRMIANFLAWRP